MQFLIYVLALFCFKVNLEADLPKKNEIVFPSQSLTAQKFLESLTSEQMDNNWNLNNFFGSVVIINLPQCTERLASIKEQLQKIGCEKFTVFSGIDGRKVVPQSTWNKFNLNWADIDLTTEEGKARYDNQRKGEAGCYLSHYHVIKEIKENFDQALKAYDQAIADKNEKLKETAYQDLLKYRSVMILEDDTGFGVMNADRISTTLKDSGKIFYEAMLEMPSEWDMFYFMTYSRQNCPNEIYKKHLVKVNAGYSAIGYAVNYLMYDRLLQKLSAIENPDTHFLLPVDTVYASMHSKFSCYAVTPSLAYQKMGVSTINSLYTPEVIQFQPFPPY